MILTPPTGRTFVVGQTYTTRRFADSVNAGLDISGNGRGCNQSFGSVTVKAISRDSYGTPISLWVTAQQRCERPDAPLLTSEFRINA